MFTKEFWLGDSGALVRAARTFAQTAAAMLTVATFTPFSIGQWVNVLVVSGTASLVSLLMSLDRREALLTEPPRQVEPTYFVTPSVEAAPGCGESLR
jgi:hypothetical protein